MNLTPTDRCFLSAPSSSPVYQLAQRHWRRVAGFTLVGLSGVILNTSILWVLVTTFGVHHLLAAGISAEASILTNFALNDRWTFRDHRTRMSYVRRAANYNGVALSGMMISITVLAVLTDVFGIYYIAANLFAMAAATGSNYALNTRFTWSLHPQHQVAVADSTA